MPRALRTTLLCAAVAVAIGGVVGATARALGLSPIRITSGSMAPAVEMGDWIVVSESDRTARRGDVVLFRYPFGSSLRAIKRVAAVAGDTVVVAAGSVAVNGRVVQRAAAPTGVMGRTQVVPQGHIFVLGDNAVGSHDSRAFGFVPETEIVASVKLVLPEPASLLQFALIGIALAGAALWLRRARRLTPQDDPPAGVHRSG